MGIQSWSPVHRGCRRRRRAWAETPTFYAAIVFTGLDRRDGPLPCDAPHKAGPSSWARIPRADRSLDETFRASSRQIAVGVAKAPWARHEDGKHDEEDQEDRA